MTLENRISKAEKNYSRFLDPAEKILWADEFFTLLTDVRLVSLKPLFLKALLLDSSHEIVLSLPIGDLNVEKRATVSGSATQVTLRSGESETFKSPLKSSEVDEFMAILKSASVKPKVIGYLQTITPSIRAEIAQRARVEDQQRKEDERDAAAEKYGQVVVSRPFATKWITIYSKGYVKVSSGMGAFKGEIERLLDIFGETDITRKSGLGRTAGAVLTSGANLLLSPGQRGNVYLAITTERNTHSIVWTRPTAESIKTMNEIVSAGKASISRGNALSETVSGQGTPHAVADLASQLASLAQLRDSGVLSEDEFEKGKAKLLG